MSDTLQPFGKNIWITPIGELLWGRRAARLDWKSRLNAAELPSAVVELISGIIKRTRLWKIEKNSVADELIAHFQDALASGATQTDAVQQFGDAHAAAKLIRRSKRRNRPLLWHALNFCFRVTLILLAIYALCVARFWLGRPTLSVNYVAKLNESILQTPESERGWPLWRQAIIGLTEPLQTGGRAFPPVIAPLFDKPSWFDQAKWIDQHGAAIQLARQAGTKASLGFILGARGSQNDAELLYSNRFVQTDANQPMISVMLPHLSYLRTVAEILSMDVKRAQELHDAGRVQADVLAQMGIGRQLRNEDGFLISQLVGLGSDQIAVNSLQKVISTTPGLLSDAQLIAFAHRLAGPNVTADLISIRAERFHFDDVVQRIYTDDGHGDGRVTLKGLQSMPINAIIATGSPDGPNAAERVEFEATLPALSASRAEVTARFNRVMDQTETDFRRPLRSVDADTYDADIKDRLSPVNRVRYRLLNLFMPNLNKVQWSCERYLGTRDGTIVAIALELYHRKHGEYPPTLAELTPVLLPQVPLDRITGDAVKYRLIAGKPVVYSVGADRIDDGGTPVKSKITGFSSAVDWSVKPADAPRGDWILYPPEGE